MCVVISANKRTINEYHDRYLLEMFGSIDSDRNEPSVTVVFVQSEISCIVLFFIFLFAISGEARDFQSRFIEDHAVLIQWNSQAWMKKVSGK